MKPVPATEDRIWAVIAHLSAVAFGMGILLPVIGWSEQRRKSNFTSFQCLQALGYQSLGYTVWFLVYLLVTVILVIIIVIALPVVAAENVQFDKFMLGWMSILIVFMFGMLAAYLLLPVIAAVSCALGGSDGTFQYFDHAMGYAGSVHRFAVAGETQFLSEISIHSNSYLSGTHNYSLFWRGLRICVWNLSSGCHHWDYGKHASGFIRDDTGLYYFYHRFIHCGCNAPAGSAASCGWTIRGLPRPQRG
jgi:uncharacterized Tic20 family protein